MHLYEARYGHCRVAHVAILRRAVCTALNCHFTNYGRCSIEMKMSRRAILRYVRTGNIVCAEGHRNTWLLLMEGSVGVAPHARRSGLALFLPSVPVSCQLRAEQCSGVCAQFNGLSQGALAAASAANVAQRG
jgi:hypothetical protein